MAYVWPWCELDSLSSWPLYPWLLPVEARQLPSAHDQRRPCLSCSDYIGIGMISVWSVSCAVAVQV